MMMVIALLSWLNTQEPMLMGGVGGHLFWNEHSPIHGTGFFIQVQQYVSDSLLVWICVRLGCETQLTHVRRGCYLLIY